MNEAVARPRPARRILKIFAKGNVDVRDSLLFSRVNGVLQWNGVNELLRPRHPGVLAKVRHETCTRLDLIPLPGEEPAHAVPADIATRLPSGSHPVERQQRTTLFDEPADVVVLSLQSAVTNALVRHRRDGWLLLPDEIEGWPDEPRSYLERECEFAGLADLDATMQRLEQLVLAIEEKLGAQVLVYNLSPVTPGERTHCWIGADDSLTLRVQRFNLALAQLSAKLGFSIVDVDRIVACAGADRLKIDLFHLTAEGWKLLAEEVVRILEERGCLDATVAA
ncbi:MAG: hypothetical protein RL684_1691 [Pseudomonadota bacterium]|jgi:hypothetical protein